MPQMAPLNWLTLMISFLMIFFLFNSLNFYSFTYTKKNHFLNKTHTSLNWKW